MKKDTLSQLFGPDLAPGDPAGRDQDRSCVTPYDAVLYAAGQLSALDSDAVELHTRSCRSCASFIAGVVSGRYELACEERLRSWLATQARQQDSAPHSRPNRGRDVAVSGLYVPLAVTGDFTAAITGQAFEAPQSFEGSTPDGNLRWRLIDEGAQIVATFETGLADFIDSSAFQLRCGSFTRRLTFMRCAGRILSTIVIPKEALMASVDLSYLGLELSVP